MLEPNSKQPGAEGPSVREPRAKGPRAGRLAESASRPSGKEKWLTCQCVSGTRAGKGDHVWSPGWGFHQLTRQDTWLNSPVVGTLDPRGWRVVCGAGSVGVLVVCWILPAVALEKRVHGEVMLETFGGNPSLAHRWQLKGALVGRANPQLLRIPGR